MCEDMAINLRVSPNHFVFNNIELNEDDHEYLLFYESNPLTVDVLGDFWEDIATITKKEIDLLETFYILVAYCKLYEQHYLDKQSIV
jgi:hypothetical protein